MMRLFGKSMLAVVLMAGAVFVTSSAAQAQSKFPATEWMKKDTRTKLGIMRAFIDTAKKDGIILRLSPEYYVKEVDATIENSIANHDERGLTTAVGIMIHTIAAMDGDWDNGQSPLEVAKNWLGPEYFEDFKGTFPQKYAKLLEPRENGSNPWRELGTGGNHHIYYDAGSLSYVSKSVVRVWVKMFYADIQEGQKDLKERGMRKRDMDNYSHDLYLYKIDCAENGFAILARYSYRKDGALIDAFDFPDRWETIPANSVVEGITKAACVGSRQTKAQEAGKPEEGKTKTE